MKAFHSLASPLKESKFPSRITDFPFTLAIVLALGAHVLLILFLKMNPLHASTPVPALNTPVTVKLVDVPPPRPQPLPQNTPLSPRKAQPSPPQPVPRTIPKPPQIPRNDGLLVKGGGSASVAKVTPRGEQARVQPELPKIETPDSVKPSSTGDYQPKLAESLKDLNKFIRPGDGEKEQEGAGGPSADPGNGVFFDSQGYDLGPWGNRVVAIVKSNWLVPVAAELGTRGVVGISFQVQRDGRLQNIRVISSSNVPSFDQAAINALNTSNPFPPLPADFPRPILPAVFRFYYNMAVPGGAD